MVYRSPTSRRHRWTLGVVFVTLAATWACGLSNNAAQPAGGAPKSATSRWGTSTVFTPAHASASAGTAAGPAGAGAWANDAPLAAINKTAIVPNSPLETRRMP